MARETLCNYESSCINNVNIQNSHVSLQWRETPSFTFTLIQIHLPTLLVQPCPYTGQVHSNCRSACALVAIHFIRATRCFFAMHDSSFHRTNSTFVSVFECAHHLHLMFHHFPMHHHMFNYTRAHSPTLPPTLHRLSQHFTMSSCCCVGHTHTTHTSAHPHTLRSCAGSLSNLTQRSFH